MKAHNTIMVILAGLAILLIFLAPGWNVGRGFGLLLLICPLIMLGMMWMMRNDRKN